MSLYKNLMVVAFMGILLLSCGKTNSATKQIGNNTENAEKLAVNLQKMSLDIEGMTCEIGCAKTIESKLSKTEGVVMASVNFDEKSGIVEFDANKTNANKIAAVVQDIADGDLYKVTGTKSIEISTKK